MVFLGWYLTIGFIITFLLLLKGLDELCENIKKARQYKNRISDDIDDAILLNIIVIVCVLLWPFSIKFFWNQKADDDFMQR